MDGMIRATMHGVTRHDVWHDIWYGMGCGMVSRVPHSQSRGGEEEEEEEADGAMYQLEMMRCLREVNVDNNTVGWYQSTTLGSFQTADMIETFASYRENIKRCVCLVYDADRAAVRGTVALKALTLKAPFLEMFKAGALTGEKLRESDTSWAGIFEEIPVKMANSMLVSTLIASLHPPAADAAPSRTDFDRLLLGTNPFLETNLGCLSDCMDDLSAEQQRFQYHYRSVQRQQQQQLAWVQKRRSDNALRRAAGEEPLPEEDPTNPIFKPIPEPSRIDMLLTTNQIANYCAQINETVETLRLCQYRGMDASESAQELQVQTQEVTMEGETPSRQVRATVVQAATVMYNTPATLDKAERLLAEAAQLGSQLVVFPEAFIGGYPRGASFGVLVGSRTDRGRDEFRRYHASAIDVPGGWRGVDVGMWGVGVVMKVLVRLRTDRGRDEFRRYHASAIDVPGPEVARLAAAAAKFGVFVVMGAIERAGGTLYCCPEVARLTAAAAKFSVFVVMGAIERAGGTLYCSVLFIDPRLGLVGRHRKTVPTALERVIWGCGDGSTAATVVDGGGVGRVGAAVCWENRMPMVRMALYGKGESWDWESTLSLIHSPSPCFTPSPSGVELYCAPTAHSRDSWQATTVHNMPPRSLSSPRPMPPLPQFVPVFHPCLIAPIPSPAGVELYCAPTAESRDSWQATVQHIPPPSLPILPLVSLHPLPCRSGALLRANSRLSGLLAGHGVARASPPIPLHPSPCFTPPCFPSPAGVELY
ncbi:unnamed protein product, partial [Closterium sp. NIES-65]